MNLRMQGRCPCKIDLADTSPPSIYAIHSILLCISHTLISLITCLWMDGGLGLTAGPLPAVLAIAICLVSSRKLEQPSLEEAWSSSSPSSPSLPNLVLTSQLAQHKH
ncbi:unnamed protein product [Pleuronectes platessa]|uniref:Uncharacterized protein n=1 Tax=Pleuronectes platessa TaxID=8262 RepID=A0A9N7TS12_PLEPL|nr:unnamed protein product [Pleuronectes platessa]